MQLAAQLQGPNMGDLLIAAIARGGDRIAFVDADLATLDIEWHLVERDYSEKFDRDVGNRQYRLVGSGRSR
jgi:hypothetical protein